MRILLTGASGFIGSHVIKSFREAGGHTVYCVGRTARMHAQHGDGDIVADLATRGWTDVLPEEIDIVVHLAQSRYYRDFPEKADDVLRINVDSTFELLDWSRRHAVKHFVYTSTGSVYRPQERLLSEDDEVAPTSFYAASKFAAEGLCAAYGVFFATTILRLFAVYGPGASDSILPRLVRRVAAGESINLDGGLGMTTTPTYVSDCADAITRSALAPRECGVQILNVCGNDDVTLADACLIAGRLLGREPELVSNDKAPLRLSASNRRARERIQWEPRTSLEEGIAAIVASL